MWIADSATEHLEASDKSSVLIHFFAIFFLSLAAKASRLRQPADFVNPEAGLPFVAQSENLKFAVARLDTPFDGKETEGCSAVIISDSGLMLTASHCLDSCRFLASGKPFKRSTEKQICKFIIRNVLQEVEVLKAATCPLKMKMDYLEKSDLERKAAKEFPESCHGSQIMDYALIQPLNKKLLSKFGCVSVAKRPAAIRESVFLLSYPRATFRAKNERPEAQDSEGFRLMFSAGKVIESPKCVTSKAPGFFSRLINGAKKISEEHYLEFLDLFGASLNSYIQTTVDAVVGSSGGPLFNLQGEVVAVTSLSGSEFQDEKNECRGSTFFQTVQTWQDDLSLSTEAKEFVSLECKEKKIATSSP